MSTAGGGGLRVESQGTPSLGVYKMRRSLQRQKRVARGAGRELSLGWGMPKASEKIQAE